MADPAITPTRSLSSVDGIDVFGQQRHQQEETNIQMNVRRLATSEPQSYIPRPVGDLIDINIVEEFTPTVAMANADMELGDVPIIRDTVQILLGCVKRGRTRSNLDPPSICMVPKMLRDINPSSFNPRIVSIGPLHRDDENVQEFEMQKETYLHDCLLRQLGSPPEQTLKACAQIVNFSIPRIRRSYVELKKYTDIQLSTMMVIDCCFILEFLHMLPTLPELFVSSIALDLILLENQIPFFVLQDIFECTRSESIPSTFLIDMLLELRKYIDPFHGNINNNYVDTYKTHDHILGLLHKSYNLASASKNLERFLDSPIPHTAAELHRAGVNFKPYEDESWPMAMKYESSKFMCFSRPWGKPTLYMPKLYIEDGTEIVLRNFIAYEQSYSTQVHHYFTSYVTAMDMLVDVEEDIEKLVSSKVVDNDLGSNEEAAKLINDICKEVSIVEFFYSQQWEELDSYYSGYWPKNIAWLRRTYFNSPWNIIALLAGIILFALTVVQTIFTITAT